MKHPNLLRELRRRFILTEEIQGGQGLFLRAIDRATNSPVGIKVPLDSMADNVRSRYIRETAISLLMPAEHPGINRFLRSEIMHGIVVSFVEVVPGRTLGAWLLANPQRVDGDCRILPIALDITMALSDLHDHFEQFRGSMPECLPFFHGDIHWDNVIMSWTDRTVLIDWGQSYRSHVKDSQSIFPPQGPEFHQHSSLAGDFGSHTDVYALGVLLYCAFCGATVVPYGRGPYRGGAVSITDFSDSPKEHPNLPPGPIRDLIHRMIRIKARPSISEVRSELISLVGRPRATVREFVHHYHVRTPEEISTIAGSLIDLAEHAGANLAPLSHSLCDYLYDFLETNKASMENRYDEFQSFLDRAEIVRGNARERDNAAILEFDSTFEEIVLCHMEGLPLSEPIEATMKRITQQIAPLSIFYAFWRLFQISALAEMEETARISIWEGFESLPEVHSVVRTVFERLRGEPLVVGQLDEERLLHLRLATAILRNHAARTGVEKCMEEGSLPILQKFMEWLVLCAADPVEIRTICREFRKLDSLQPESTFSLSSLPLLLNRVSFEISVILWAVHFRDIQIATEALPYLRIGTRTLDLPFQDIELVSRARAILGASVGRARQGEREWRSVATDILAICGEDVLPDTDAELGFLTRGDRDDLLLSNRPELVGINQGIRQYLKFIADTDWTSSSVPVAHQIQSWIAFFEQSVESGHLDAERTRIELIFLETLSSLFSGPVPIHIEPLPGPRAPFDFWRMERVVFLTVLWLRATSNDFDAIVYLNLLLESRCRLLSSTSLQNLKSACLTQL